MTRDPEDLEKRREKINLAAEEHRQKRDEYNHLSKEWAKKRDELNEKARELIREATKFKEMRDKYNALVKEEKVKRDEGNRKISKLTAEINRLKSDLSKKRGVNLEKMKRELRRLEKKQETMVLTREEEREVVEAISRINAEIKKEEERLESNPIIKSKMDELKKIREETELHHKKLSEYAELAQKQHDEMTRLYEEADRIRGEADKAQNEFIRIKTLADEEHKKHVDLIHQLRDYDRVLFATREKQKAKGEKGEDARQLAEEIFKRFKSGEALSTEDLLILQKSGYL